MALIILRATPFFQNYLELVEALDYPKNKLHLFVHNAVAEYTADIDAFARTAGAEYASLKQISAEERMDETEVRTLSVAHALRQNTDYLFVVDADARLDNAQTLRELVAQNRAFVAPLLKRHKEVWSNFWGALSESGYYARSHDYMAIVEETIR